MVCIRTCILVLLVAVCTSAFMSWNAPFGNSMRRSPALYYRSPLGLKMGIIDDIVERKKKEVDALKANPPPGVAERLANMGKEKSKDVVLKALKKPKGTITVIPEMKFRTPKLGKFCEKPMPDILGGHYYEAGASAVCVHVDEEGYGFGLKDLEIVVKGQKANQGNFPGPLPCIAYDTYIDPIQLAVAAESGAKGVFLNVAALKSQERTKEMMAACEGLGLDCIVEVHNEHEVKIAVDAGAKIIGVCNRDQNTFEQISAGDYVTREWTVPIEETVFNLKNLIPDSTLKLAYGSVNETLMAWKLRDYGYGSVMVGDALMRGSEMRMASGPYQSAYNEAKGLIKAFKSKGSVKYGPSSTASFYGKGEGARETLGEMGM